MKLTGQEVEEVIETFVEAFERKSLDRMLRVRLDRRLDRLTAEGELDNILLDVLSAAERDGWTADLIREATAWNPGNRRLATLASSLLPQLEGAEALAGPSGQQRRTIETDPGRPRLPLAVLRRLAIASFDVPRLLRFCQTSVHFQPVLPKLPMGSGAEEMVDVVLEHTLVSLVWGELLAGVGMEHHAAVRDLLTAAFDVAGLRRFCHIHEPFRPLLDQFGADRLDDMVDRLLVYTDKRFLWDEMLAAVAEENPYQWEQFLRRLEAATWHQAAG